MAFCNAVVSPDLFQLGMRRKPGWFTEDILNFMSLSPNSQSFMVCYLVIHVYCELFGSLGSVCFSICKIEINL